VHYNLALALGLWKMGDCEGNQWYSYIESWIFVCGNWMLGLSYKDYFYGCKFLWGHIAKG